jgi:heme/copper-type cytochrome/quinol oxidase subunit 2
LIFVAPFFTSVILKNMKIFETVVYLIISICIVFLPIGIIGGIVYAIRSSKQPDQAQKSHDRNIMWKLFLTPILVIVLVVIIWGLINIISAIYK